MTWLRSPVVVLKFRFECLNFLSMMLHVKLFLDFSSPEGARLALRNKSQKCKIQNISYINCGTFMLPLDHCLTFGLWITEGFLKNEMTKNIVSLGKSLALFHVGVICFLLWAWCKSSLSPYSRRNSIVSLQKDRGGLALHLFVDPCRPQNIHDFHDVQQLRITGINFVILGLLGEKIVQRAYP